MKRWIEWGFGCFLGLLPLGAWIFAHQFPGPAHLVAAGATRELLFFALSTASTGLLNLSDRGGMWNFGGIVITICAALCYGEFLTGEALHAAMQVRFVYNVSMGLAVSAFVYSALITGITHRRSSK